MKKKLLSLLLAILMCVSGIVYTGIETKAEDTGEDIAFSELLTEDALIGISEMQTRGVYLAEGNSFINKLGTSKIGAGGNTVASLKCKVSVTVVVEKLIDGSWNRVTSWTASTASGYSASLSKSLYIATGYYYRVRGTHYASTDRSSSSTGSLWM